ncbi:hypothetical protein [Evansella cellulosilytica]|uniref:Group-specific protein n=1 Tax=Evansella cellulosilytica (strain ATCC 21833 / DSM 2522 / FERM P-1141 / JCM 9156 / N-4) TaxID=649639 RepID=E6U0W7_EVAC2|nr:hypothetical protein [Evansella cellulosilytica]ADU30279.1 hypothetical protein Bcell_2017 [Evansella cellulosilytica DSM 2522]
MSKCNIDHSFEDVQNKLALQKKHIPKSLYEAIESYLNPSIPQLKLNELFHYLKKYDLVSPEERTVRNAGMQSLIE